MSVKVKYQSLQNTWKKTKVCGTVFRVIDEFLQSHSRQLAYMGDPFWVVSWLNAVESCGKEKRSWPELCIIMTRLLNPQ